MVGPCTYIPHKKATLGSASRVPAASDPQTAPFGDSGTGTLDQAVRPRQLHFPGSAAASPCVGRRLPLTHYKSQNAPRSRCRRQRGQTSDYTSHDPPGPQPAREEGSGSRTTTPGEHCAYGAQGGGRGVVQTTTLHRNHRGVGARGAKRSPQKLQIPE